jgi:hypothetical protein
MAERARFLARPARVGVGRVDDKSVLTALVHCLTTDFSCQWWQRKWWLGIRGSVEWRLWAGRPSTVELAVLSTFNKHKPVASTRPLALRLLREHINAYELDDQLSMESVSNLHNWLFYKKRTVI